MESSSDAMGTGRYKCKTQGLFLNGSTWLEDLDCKYKYSSCHMNALLLMGVRHCSKLHQMRL